MMDSILFKGDLAPSDISISYRYRDKYSHNLGQLELDAVWNKYLDQAKKTNRKIWDAVLYRLINISYHEDKLRLDLGSVKVKEILAAREGLITDHSPDNLFITSLIKTSDDLYLFGRKSIEVQNNAEMIGGTLSQSEMEINSGNDLLKALYTEFDEEINMQTDYVQSSSLIGVIRTQVQSVGLIWQSQSILNSSEVRRRFEEKNDGEIKELVFVGEADLSSFLKAQVSYLPLITELIKRDVV